MAHKEKKWLKIMEKQFIRGKENKTYFFGIKKRLFNFIMNRKFA